MAGHQPADDRPGRGDGRQAAAPTAGARLAAHDRGDVPELSGVAAVAAIELAVYDHPAADTRPDVQVQQVLDPPSRAVLELTERAEVGVVVHEDRHTAQAARELAACVDTGPAPHGRLPHHPAAVGIDRPRQAETDADDASDVLSGLGKHVTDQPRGQLQHREAVGGRLDRQPALREHLRGQVDDRHTNLLAVDGRADGDARVRAQRDHRAGATATRTPAGGRCSLDDQAPLAATPP